MSPSQGETERHTIMSSNTVTMVPATTAKFIWLASCEDLGEDHALVKFYRLREQGTVWKQMPGTIKEQVTYAIGSKFEQRQRAIALGECIDLDGSLAKMSPTQFAVWVREQRLAYSGDMPLENKTGLSWAEIMVRCAQGEAVVSKAFESVANADRKGQRIGHGGRFAEDNGAAYAGKAKRHGWIRPKSDDLDPELAFRLMEITGSSDAANELAGLSSAELKALAKELGLKATGSKAVLAKRIAVAQANA